MADRADKIIMTDGMNVKSINPWDIDGNLGAWTFHSGAPRQDQDTLYARVAAAFRAFNLKANTVGNMPFLLMKGTQEFDNTATWENKVGFLPNPSELFRLNTLSYMATNTVYNMRTSNILGERTKGLYHAVAYNFTPRVNGQGTDVDYIERKAGSTIERYQFPLDKKLVRMWRLDHTTELLPSPNTEALAIMTAAGEIYFADLWIKHFYQGGGIKPMLVAMKGMVAPDVKAEKEQSWWNWLRGLGQYTYKKARIYNADSLSVEQFGSGVDDLKDNKVYEQALANIAMGTGMPLSLLMANSANYATAKEEKATWYENDIIPLCNWMAYEYNRQVFEPLGLRMEFHPETLDPQQEDETERAQAINTFIDFLAKCPTYDIFIGTADTFGYELSDKLVVAAEKYYADKEVRAEETRQQMQGAGVVLGPDGKPVEQAEPGKDEEAEEDEDEEKKPFPPAKWTPSLDQLRELQRWQELAFRKLKRAEPLSFEWRNDTLPADVHNDIAARLVGAEGEDAVKAAFDTEAYTEIPAPARKKHKSDDNILMLAVAMNRMADAAATQPQAKSLTRQDDMQIVINNPANVEMTHKDTLESLKALTERVMDMKASMDNPQVQPPPSITFSPIIQPSEVVNQNNINVQPTPVEVKNDVTVRPAPVNVIEKGKRVAKVKRDVNGKITEITADDEA